MCRKDGKERSVFFWAISQQPDSDRSASRLGPAEQSARTETCPVIGIALSTRKKILRLLRAHIFHLKVKNEQLHGNEIPSNEADNVQINTYFHP